ncbi:MAG: DNA polymerase III subunit delta' [Gemmataceae bacterium]
MSWERIRGHERWIQTFEQVYRQGRLAHSYLFVGLPGIGKRLFARELAKTLLCEKQNDSSEFQACDQCVSCRMADANTHPDLHIVGRPPQSIEMPIAVMRELCRNFTLKPSLGRGKVAILDDADDLNEESANCFLKTLEEPPPRAVFFLIGTSRDRQIPTILSRCQVIRFSPLPAELLSQLLQNHGLDEQAINRLVPMCEGSVGMALELADPDLWHFRRTLLKGIVNPKKLDAPALGKVWLGFLEQEGKENALQRRRCASVLKLLIEFLSDALAHSMEGTPRVTDQDDKKLYQTFTEYHSPERMMELAERCMDAEYQLRRYLPVSLIVDGLLDAFCE